MNRPSMKDQTGSLDPVLLLKTLTALKKGNFSFLMPVSKTGVTERVAETLNEILDMNSHLVREIQKLSVAIGKTGKITQRIPRVSFSGGWADCVDAVNTLIDNLVRPTNEVGRVIGAVAHGDLSQTMSVEREGRPLKGEFLRTAKIVNGMVYQLSSFGSEVTRVAREVGTEGRLGGQAAVKGISGIWKELTDNVNSMARNLTAQVRDIVQVTTAVARGDLTKKIAVDVHGEILELKNTINTMVDQLSSFASEVTRMAREVGTEGKLGGQAIVKDVAGTWKDMTDNLNAMASNLTSQLRNSMEVTTAVARGDLSKKITSDVRGEFLELKNTINTMVDQLSSFGSEVTRVAREAGVEGKLGGQARTPGATGMWRDLTDNVNQLAGNLTTQVRSIAEIATGVIKGDLSRSIMVEAQGEVASLNDNLNEMIRNLKATTRINTEQDWLKTNLAKFARLLQGQRDLVNVSRLVLSELAPLVIAQHGAFYFTETSSDQTVLRLLASYAEIGRSSTVQEFAVGQGLVGQCAAEKKLILLTDVPEDYIQIGSGLGTGRPLNLVIIPVLFEGQVKAVIELASFQRFTEIHLSFLDQLVESIGIVLNTIAASMRTEELLKKSQTQTEELQGQQEKLQKQNEELEERARLLVQQKDEVEQKRLEVEEAKQALEEKAEQLSLSSKYKSEFLANMSHEIRTPLNSILILSKVVSDNPGGEMTEKQVELIKTIHSSGSDLLDLINDILDLSKVESGTMSLDFSEVTFQEIGDSIEQTFRGVATNKGLQFTIEIDHELPQRIQTDMKRLKQILKNLLSNAFKFTEKGEVVLGMRLAERGWNSGNSRLQRADTVIAFSVIDEGIGISEEKHAIIFEAFQQADGTTSRKYGGTGLGLSISREVAHILGGEIQLQSELGRGSKFTLFLPASYLPAEESVPDREKRLVEPELPPKRVGIASRAPAKPMVEDDRMDLQGADKSVLIVEPDLDTAVFLLAEARKNGFKGIVTDSGENAFELAKHYAPSAVAIDSALPDANVWTVVDRLKHQPLTRHIPVVIVSEKNIRRGAGSLGVWAYLEKPLTTEAIDSTLTEIDQSLVRRRKICLLVKADSERRDEIARVIRRTGVDLIVTAEVSEVLQVVDTGQADCVVFDSYFAKTAVDEFLEHLNRAIPGKRKPSLIFYSEPELSLRQESALRVKVGDMKFYNATTVDRLFEWVTLELHLDVGAWDQTLRTLLERQFFRDSVFAGKTVHIVDDDMRNIFALTAVLETYRIKVTYSEDGQSAIEHLKNTTADLVLMDIMMPGKDGYETMKELRTLEHFKTLPIVALTAKAMKGDREKCLLAGATDYITKPIETDKLMSLIRIWLQT